MLASIVSMISVVNNAFYRLTVAHASVLIASTTGTPRTMTAKISPHAKSMPPACTLFLTNQTYQGESALYLNVWLLIIDLRRLFSVGNEQGVQNTTSGSDDERASDEAPPLTACFSQHILYPNTL